MARRKRAADPVGDALEGLPPASGEVGARGQVADRRQARIAQLITQRLSGMTWQQIADANGYTDKSNPRRVVADALKERVADGVDELRHVEHARYERATQALWPKVLGGDTDAIRTWLRVSESLRRLHGMDAPVKVELSAGVEAALSEALDELAEAVLGDTIPGEVIASDRQPDA